MTNLFTYLLEVSCVFTALYVLYIVFLSKLTFHNLNRIVLLMLLPVSLSLPFSTYLFPSITSKISEVPFIQQLPIETIQQQFQSIEQPLTTTSFNYVTLLMGLYGLVGSIYLLRILLQTRHLFIVKNNAQMKQLDGYTLIAANVSEIFSYFHWIFIPQQSITNFNKHILEHEKVHVRLKHSWDIMFTEIYRAFFWFNPLLYFYRKSLKSVHEFQADKAVLQTGVKTSRYLQLLLQSLEIQSPNNLYNYFNEPLLKKRVAMMTRSASNKLLKLTYILLFPACALIISAFTLPEANSDSLVNIVGFLNDTNSTPSLFPVQYATKANITAHFKEDGIVHTGIDIRAHQGTAILASADGKITKADLEGDWGNLIIITHTNGFETWYAHLKGFNITENEAVIKGDIIGYVGTTGKSSGPHLHYEVKQHGKHLDPLDYLE